jgi:hypothetical protein
MAGLSKMSKAMRPGEFQRAARHHPRMSAKSLAAARALLVDGRSFEDITAELGGSRQLVHEWATKIYEAFCPPGWQTEKITLPAELMRRVLDMQRDERSRWNDAQKESLQNATQKPGSGSRSSN